MMNDAIKTDKIISKTFTNIQQVNIQSNTQSYMLKYQIRHIRLIRHLMFDYLSLFASNIH